MLHQRKSVVGNRRLSSIRVSADIVRNERDLEARMGLKGGPNACTGGKLLLRSALIDFEGPFRSEETLQLRRMNCPLSW